METRQDLNAPATLQERRQTAPTCEQRRELGRAARKKTPRGSHAKWTPAPDRADPVDLLEAQARNRLPELAPIRYARMTPSPFTFMRGSAVVMAHDLAQTPDTGIHAQLCGDCHLLNFGVFASPERTLLFDVNDFDETLPGPWEWDVKRLATSFVVAGRENGFGSADCRRAAREAVRSYRQRMAEYSQMGELEVWYSHVRAEEIFDLISDSKSIKRVKKAMRKARGRDSLQALSKLTRVVDGRRIIDDDPPLLVRIVEEELREQIDDILQTYRSTLQDDRRHLLDQFRLVDVARKVVGVGSVGTRDFIVLFEGRDEDDPLFLQVKETETSVLESHLPKSTYENHGQRVVAGQRLMQAASDIFLGWLRGPGGRDFYWRQLRDMKGSAKVERMSPGELVLYAGLCGWALSRAHARSGDRVQIAAYLGKSERFDRAIADFAEAYADQTERDHAALCAAVKSGKLPVDAGA
ncbi:MAG TPA: DUF2252 domain-containing protein [Rubrobacter sp.]|nr:DUF2252 domain-containing protein [Rubrobacter sp.]